MKRKIDYATGELLKTLAVVLAVPQRKDCLTADARIANRSPQKYVCSENTSLRQISIRAILKRTKILPRKSHYAVDCTINNLEKRCK